MEICDKLPAWEWGTMTLTRYCTCCLKAGKRKPWSWGHFSASAGVHSAGELLRLILLYLTGGRSFAGTSALLRLKGECILNKIAVYKRVLGSWEWLAWLSENICRHAGLPAEKPAWLGDRNVCIVDG
ncbi:MAG: hypothetical protein LBK44_05845, partial [Spirochaetales bacterium]|nr:hypothetical protein [Spirochaetales bacterium]